MEHIDFETYIANYEKYQDLKRVVCVTSQQPCVLTRNNNFNKSFCEENNISIYYTGHRGGTIINSTEDVSIGLFNCGHCLHVIQSLVSYLRGKGLSCVLDDNDILVDGYKVIGISQRHNDKGSPIAMHISIVVDLDLIKNICTKPMNKVPKGLSEFGITREEIIEFIQSLNFEEGRNYAI